MHAKESRERRIRPRELLTGKAISGGTDRRTAKRTNRAAGDTELRQFEHTVGLKLAVLPEIGRTRCYTLLRPGSHAVTNRALVIGEQVVDTIEVAQRERSFGCS